MIIPSLTTLSVLLLTTTAFNCVNSGIVAVEGEQYTFDFTSLRERPSVVSSSSSSSSSSSVLETRNLQSDSDPCYYSGDKLVCLYSFAAGSVGNETTINFMAQCDINPQLGFDYRKASNCACLAEVIPAKGYGKEKQCPCTVCSAEIGETPVSVDCSMHDTTANNTTIEPETGIITTSRAENVTDVENDDEVIGSVLIVDNSTSNATMTTTTTNATSSNTNTSVVDPYIFATCTSIDCFGACNGTCSLNCNDPSGNVCPYCTPTFNYNTTGTNGTGTDGGGGGGGNGNSNNDIPDLAGGFGTSNAIFATSSHGFFAIVVSAFVSLVV